MKDLSWAALACCLLAACGGGAGNGAAEDAAEAAEVAAETAAPAGEECVVGSYQMTEDGVTKSFTFNADRTGQEVQSESDIRPLTWELKDAQTLHITYTPHGDVAESQWDLGFDCVQKTVSWGGARYVKP